MKTKVLLFGILADVAGQSIIEIDKVPDTDTLLNKVREINPFFSHLKFATAVNKRIVLSNQFLDENDEVALLPPFSGG